MVKVRIRARARVSVRGLPSTAFPDWMPITRIALVLPGRGNPPTVAPPRAALTVPTRAHLRTVVLRSRCKSEYVSTCKRRGLSCKRPRHACSHFHAEREATLSECTVVYISAISGRRPKMPSVGCTESEVSWLPIARPRYKASTTNSLTKQVASPPAPVCTQYPPPTSAVNMPTSCWSPMVSNAPHTIAPPVFSLLR
eukprot:scaffold104593_cov69-Phaeocystis_antarctica.AAC.6